MDILHLLSTQNLKQQKPCLWQPHDARPLSGCKYIPLLIMTPLSTWRTVPAMPLTSFYWTWVRYNYSWWVKIANRGELQVHFREERLCWSHFLLCAHIPCMFVLESTAFWLRVWDSVTCSGNVTVSADILQSRSACVHETEPNREHVNIKGSFVRLYKALGAKDIKTTVT